MFIVLQTSLQARGDMMPAIYITLLSNILNVGANYLVRHAAEP